MNPASKPAAIILAAGASSRMGRSKPLLQFEGETFIDRLITRFEVFCHPVIVVLGYGAEQVQSGVQQVAAVQFVINERPELGMLSSLQCGLRATKSDVLFTPVDLPSIRSSTIRLLAATVAEVVIPRFGGRRGHPVRVSRAVALELLALPIDAQAREVIRRHEATLIDVNDSGILHDVDTPADYEALLAGVSREA